MAKKKTLEQQPVQFPTIEDITRQQQQASLQNAPQDIPDAPQPPTAQQRQQAIRDEMRAPLNNPAPQNSAAGLAAANEQMSGPAVGIKSREDLSNEETDENYGTRLANAMAVDPTRAAIGDAYHQQEKSFADYLQGIKDDYERERQAAQQEVEQDQRAARWTGATELAAAIANMIGVGSTNAVSQQHKTYSQDWMRKADQDSRERRNRLDNIRQRQRETELKIAQLRSQGGLALAQYDANKRQQDIQNAMAAQKAALDAQYKAGQLTLDQYKAETERLKAKATADYNAGRLANDTMRARASAASSYSTATYNKERTEQLRKSGGSGSSSDLTLTFDTTDEIPGEKIRIKDQSLLRTIEANVDSFNEEDQRAVTRILNNYSINSDEKARQLLPYIKNSSRMRDLVRSSATSTEAYGTRPQQKKEEEPEQKPGKKQSRLNKYQ